jgi:hypothetical protein
MSFRENVESVATGSALVVLSSAREHAEQNENKKNIFRKME